MHAGRPERAVGLLRKALTSLGAASDAELRVRVLVALALAEAERGRWEPGHELLAEAAEIVAGSEAGAGLRGLVRARRGALLLRDGKASEALPELDAAVSLLGDDPAELATALLHRGGAQLSLRRMRGAAADFDHCLRVAEASEVAGQPGVAAVAGLARHHRGYLALLTGDLPAAVRDLATARAELAPLVPGVNPGAVHRARALRAAGLLGAADAELAVAAGALRARRVPQGLAEVELERAEVALLDRRPSDAWRWARQACRRLRRAANETWAVLAELLALQAAQAMGTTPARVAGQARTIANQLLAAGLDEDARVARLVGARAELAAGRGAEAADLAAAPARREDRIGTRLFTRVVQAELTPDPRTRAAHLRAGFDELQRLRRSSRDSMDLRTATALHGRRLAELGVQTALADGRPSVVLAWSERARELAVDLPPVRRPADPLVADLLAELRAVRCELRATPGPDRGRHALQARRAALERQIRRRDWHAAAGADRDPAGVQRPARLGELRAALNGGLLVSYLAVEGRLYALVVTARHAQVVTLGLLAGIADDVSRVRADLDALATVVLPERLREVVRRSLRAGLRRLDAALWWPLADVGDGPVVVVPTGSLAAVPWTSLPGLRNRPVTVAPSATWWLEARSPVPAQGRPVFVAGPALARAETEVLLAAAAWPSATVLTAERATPSAVLAASAHSPLLHVAAHGVHEPDSPMFSALELTGGSLYGHELPETAGPRHVVLSAGHLGLAGARQGDETLGMTGALLHGGAVSVVSGVSRLGDAVACEVMIAHHRELRAGHPPATALANALAATGADRAADGTRPDPAPLVCFGAGW